ncbi:hypothetical protein [Devosia sp. MC521]|uniref:hypothetical protein n=1 Tax=Devosia sp. MC521 TaxID=2759954 RepID=UPI0015FDF10C|nr:hypothetical protein [Devosia sp. MC521]MBJ6987283.1 hypothetical protein [Devosia sp. MC521]QMW62891.1 hypothetical protein H4N61_00520 [Devosia sp. MC521]
MHSLKSATFAAAIILMGCSQSTNAATVAFGIDMGTTISDLEVDRKVSETEMVIAVPNPHPLLSLYSATATASAGVCVVVGYAPMAAREDITRTIATIRSQLDEVYGENTNVPISMDATQLDAWFWLGDGDLKWVSVTLHGERDASEQAAMVKWTYRNEEDCNVIAMPNPFN